MTGRLLSRFVGLHLAAAGVWLTLSAQLGKTAAAELVLDWIREPPAGFYGIRAKGFG